MDVNIIVLRKNKSLLTFINVLLYCVKSTIPCISDKPVHKVNLLCIVYSTLISF